MVGHGKCPLSLPYFATEAESGEVVFQFQLLATSGQGTMTGTT